MRPWPCDVVVSVSLLLWWDGRGNSGEVGVSSLRAARNGLAETEIPTSPNPETIPTSRPRDHRIVSAGRWGTLNAGGGACEAGMDGAGDGVAGGGSAGTEGNALLPNPLIDGLMGMSAAVGIELPTPEGQEREGVEFDANALGTEGARSVASANAGTPSLWACRSIFSRVK